MKRQFYLIFMLIVIVFFLVVVGIRFSPRPDNADEIIGVVSSGLSLFLSVLVATIWSGLDYEKRTEKLVHENLEKEYRTAISKIVDNLVPYTGRINGRIKQAMDGNEGHLIAARDNAQNLTQIIVELSKLCDANITEKISELQTYQDEVDTAATQMTGGGNSESANSDEIYG